MKDIIIQSIVIFRLQLIKSETLGSFVNVYAPSGSQGERERRVFGDWNCLVRGEDSEGGETSNNNDLNKKISVHLKQLINDVG